MVKTTLCVLKLDAARKHEQETTVYAFLFRLLRQTTNLTGTLERYGNYNDRDVILETVSEGSGVFEKFVAVEQ